MIHEQNMSNDSWIVASDYVQEFLVEELNRMFISQSIRQQRRYHDEKNKQRTVIKRQENCRSTRRLISLLTLEICLTLNYKTFLFRPRCEEDTSQEFIVNQKKKIKTALLGTNFHFYFLIQFITDEYYSALQAPQSKEEDKINRVYANFFFPLQHLPHDLNKYFLTFVLIYSFILRLFIQ